MTPYRATAGALAVALSMVVFETTPFLAQDVSSSKPVSFVVSADYDAATMSKAIDDLDLIRDLEVHGWNGRLAWDLLEPQRARPLLAALHQAATVADGYDVDVHLTLTAPAADQGTASAAVSDEAAAGATARAADVQRAASLLAAEMARHRNVRSYAIELRADGRDAVTAGDVGSLLTSAATAVRSRHPAAAVVFGGLSPASGERLQRLCSAASIARAFSTVRVAVNVDTALDAVTAAAAQDLPAFAAAVDRACGRKRIWLEAAATAPAAGEREEAAAWVRAIATAIAEPRVEQVGLGLRDVARGGSGAPAAGLVRADGTKKMLFSTVDMLTDLFGTETISVDNRVLRVTPATTGGDLHAHLFTRRDGDRVLIAWNRTAASTVKVEVPGIGSSVEFDVDGRPLHWDPNAEPLANLTLSPGVPRIFRLAPKTS